jgi:hypothetical protein
VGERDVGNGQRGARADNGQRGGIALGSAESTMAITCVSWLSLREQRPDGPVDQTAGENFFFGRASFALDEAAGKLAGGVSVLAIIDGQREERLASGFGSSLDRRSPGPRNRRSGRSPRRWPAWPSSRFRGLSFDHPGRFQRFATFLCPLLQAAPIWSVRKGLRGDWSG